jgi:hypothetical protein
MYGSLLGALLDDIDLRLPDMSAVWCLSSPPLPPKPPWDKYGLVLLSLPPSLWRYELPLKLSCDRPHREYLDSTLNPRPCAGLLGDEFPDFVLPPTEISGASQGLNNGETSQLLFSPVTAGRMSP